jgi:predicted transcriptional regulator
MPKKPPSKKKAVKLTPGELEILEMLWTEGPVHLTRTRSWFKERGRNLAVSTLHTRLNRLVDKGIINRIAENPAMYQAAVKRNEVTGRYAELITELCGRNWIPMVAQLAEERDFTAEEIAFLERVIERQKKRKPKEPEV